MNSLTKKQAWQRRCRQVGMFVFSGILAIVISLSLIVLAASAAQPVAPRATEAIIVVNTVDDELNSDGDCSLREAIQAANSDTATDACPAGLGADTINFNIGGGGAHTITLNSFLPAINTSMTLNGASQPGYSGTPLIHLDYFGTVLFISGATGVMVDALDLSWSGSSRSGTGINMQSGSNITVQNVTANNRSTGVSSINTADVRVQNSDLENNTTALSLWGLSAGGTLPGGVLVSGNSYANSGTGVHLLHTDILTVSDGSLPGTNVLISNSDGLTTTDFIAVSLTDVHTATVAGLDLSWSGGSRSGRGVYVDGGSNITVTNVTANNRSIGASFINSMDVWVQNSDLDDNDTALRLWGITAGTLPGGMLVSGNTYANSYTGLELLYLSDLTISNGSLPGTNVQVNNSQGLATTEGFAVDLTSVDMTAIAGLDLSWSGASRSGYGIFADEGSDITVKNVTATNRNTGISFIDTIDVRVQDSSLDDNDTGLRLWGVQTATVSCATARNGNNGFYVLFGASDITANYNWIAGNSTGLRNSTAQTVDGENNYWGSPDGPSNLGGSGDSYTGSVDAQPFLAAPPVCPRNTAPEAANDAYTSVLDTPLVVSNVISGVLGNDNDDDGDAITAVLDQDVATGTLALSPDGTFSYTPPLSFLGTVTFTYRATDTIDFSNVATVTIFIGCPPNPALSITVCPYIDGMDVSLNWLHNLDAAGGYEVHAGTVPYFTTGPATLTATLPVGSQTYSHGGVIGNLVNYYYYVMPLNCPGCITPTSNHVGKFEFAVVPGS